MISLLTWRRLIRVPFRGCHDHRDAGRCETLLAQASRGSLPAFDATGWRESWRGSRPGDRTEAFVLFRRAR